ncbi:hypothetical protein RAC83_001023 [Xylella fastidiosa]|nr:hypothetical protein [Xylella fastidiosa]
MRASRCVVSFFAELRSVAPSTKSLLSSILNGFWPEGNAVALRFVLISSPMIVVPSAAYRLHERDALRLLGDLDCGFQ